MSIGSWNTKELPNSSTVLKMAAGSANGTNTTIIRAAAVITKLPMNDFEHLCTQNCTKFLSFLLNKYCDS